MKDVVADIRPFDDPVPPDLHDLDLITFQFLYHDTTYMNVDRVEMNRKLFAVLKPGGFLLIADHSALPGQGTSVGKPCTASRKARCDKKSKRPASILSPKGISGATQPTRMTIPVTSRPSRSTISCSSFRSRCELDVVHSPYRTEAREERIGSRGINWPGNSRTGRRLPYSSGHPGCSRAIHARSSRNSCVAYL